ncbi:hypothetical protein RJ639_017512 [Escallonia herrerae]|uniref:Zinc finger LSD1-type domain-containing protein n=1 Tax=Escallonia herrerae TaxID=1293975 RepID=A0AA88VC43_9ASTE|nr:hypothetical protein RJ639_017512 [Escallonia herrerae]
MAPFDPQPLQYPREASTIHCSLCYSLLLRSRTLCIKDSGEQERRGEQPSPASALILWPGSEEMRRQEGIVVEVGTKK